MTRGKLFQVLGTVGLMGLVTLLMTSGFILIVALFSTGLISLFPAYPQLINSISTSSVLFVVLIIISFTQILTYEVLLVSYHAEKGDQPIELIAGEKIKKSGKWTLITLAVIFSIVVSVVYSYDVLDPLPNETVVVAHRGDTSREIENTLNVLRYASELKPDFVERDVQLSKDNQLVVHHDFTLKRLVNDSRKLNEVDFDEIMAMTIHKGKMSDQIAGFEDYMNLAKELDQKIMVELKPDSRKSENFVDDVVAVVERSGMSDHVYYQSLDKNIILELKDKYPDATAGDIIGFNLGNLEYLNIDFYSLEASGVNKKLVQTLNFWNKGLFVWTVDDTQSMKNYIDL